VPCGSYRAPGQPQVVFAVESHTDMIAHEMGIDPYALRLRNVLQDGQVCATGGRYKHVRGEATLRAAVEAANWGAPKSGPYVGRGISLGQRPQGQSVYSVTVSMDAHARATFYTLVPDTGTGAHTVGRQVVAEDLGIPVEDVTAVPRTPARAAAAASAGPMPRWAPPRACVNNSPSWPPSSTAGRKSGSSSAGGACSSRETRTRVCPSRRWPPER